MLIFKKLTNTQNHYVQICCSECHPNWTLNVESMDINPRMSPLVKYGFCCADFLKLKTTQLTAVDIFYIKIY